MEVDKLNMLYFAYGEHMNENEMYRSFPHARMVGMSRLEGYCLCFAGRDGLARAALEVAQGQYVPGRVWSLYEADAEELDRMADDPHFARREIRILKVDGVAVPVLVYITVQGQQHGRPGFVTYDIMREAYETAGEDVGMLRMLAMQSAP